MYKKIIFYVVAVWLVLTQTLPPINLLFPIPTSLKFVIFDAVTILLFPKLLSKKSIVALFAFTLTAFLYYGMGNAFFDSIATVLVPLVVMLSGLLLIEYAKNYDEKYGFTRIIVLVAIISNVIMALISIPQVLINPNIIRPSVLEKNMEEDVYVWLITYHACHGLPFLFAPILFMCRKMYRGKKMFSLLWFSAFIILFYIVFRSNATTPFLISIIMVIAGLFFKMETFSRKYIGSIIIIGTMSIMMFQPSIMIPIIDTVQSVMDPSANNYKKMDEIKFNIMYGDMEGDLGARQDLYTKSLELFIKSPLIGTSDSEMISHHSWFLDRLACFGILFSIPMILLFVFHIKETYRNMRHTKVIYVMGLFGFILMLCLKNEFGSGSWLYGFALLPLLCRYVDFVLDNKLIK